LGEMRNTSTALFRKPEGDLESEILPLMSRRM
jgi:hypothetical protein